MYLYVKIVETNELKIVESSAVPNFKPECTESDFTKKKYKLIDSENTFDVVIIYFAGLYFHF